MQCKKCGSQQHVYRDGKEKDGTQIWRHRKCPMNNHHDYCFAEDEQQQQNQFNYTFEETKDGKSTISSSNFQSISDEKDKILNEFLDECDIDKKKWIVEKYKISAWDVSSKYRDQDLKFDNGVMDGHAIRKNKWIRTKNYSISVTLARNKYAWLIEGFENYIKQVPEFKYINKLPHYRHKTGHALEAAPFDAHLGKMAWIDETGYRNYDLDIAVEDYEYSIDEMLKGANPWQPEKIFYIVGQDLFHVDNMEGETTRGGHSLDVDGRMPKIYEKVFITVTKSIYKCRVMAPVEVIWIPGNHDYLASMFLTYALHEHFKNDDQVDVDIWKEQAKRTRKARLWGNLLVGWTHQISKTGQTVWGNELAQSFPELWGRSVFREWHSGHWHKKQSTKTTPEFTSGGVLCRQLTALSPVDRWHYENTYTDAVPGGEAFIWTLDRGIKSNIVSWVGQYEKSRNKNILGRTCPTYHNVDH